MLPTLEPGWFVLVNPQQVQALDDQVVLAVHPRQSDLLILKRARSTQNGQVWLTSDNSAEGSDSRSFGPVEAAAIQGRVSLVLDHPRLRIASTTAP